MKQGDWMASNCMKLISKLGETRINSSKMKLGRGTHNIMVLKEEKAKKKYTAPNISSYTIDIKLAAQNKLKITWMTFENGCENNLYSCSCNCICIVFIVYSMSFIV
jgi:carbamoylphosphate synthase small subunit